MDIKTFKVIQTELMYFFKTVSYYLLSYLFIQWSQNLDITDIKVVLFILKMQEWT